MRWDAMGIFLKNFSKTIEKEIKLVQSEKQGILKILKKNLRNAYKRIKIPFWRF